MRIVLTAAVLVAHLTWACSLLDLPNQSSTLEAGQAPPGEASSSDTEAPGALTLSSATVNLVKNGCDGSGASCPQLDTVEVVFAASDAQTADAQLRYVASFGDTEAAATSADATLLFHADPDDVHRVTAYLGFAGARSGVGFARQKLCFTMAAVDVAGNVGARSAARCLDTVAESGAVISQGTPCGGGCSVTPVPALLGLVLLFARRRLAAK